MAKYFKIICLKLLFLSSIISQTKNIRFETLDIDAGLSNNTVNCILQDKQGFMWFGTNNGLNKFDGYEFTQYFSTYGDSNSISDNLIFSICEDYSGNIWIGTSNGLNLFDPAKEKFHRIFNNPLDSSGLPSNTVYSIVCSRDSNLWMGTADGLALLDTSEIQKVKCSQPPKFKTYMHYPLTGLSLKSNEIRYLMEDRLGRLWISSWCKGISLFDRKEEQFINFEERVTDKSENWSKKIFSKLPSLCIFCFSLDPFDDNILWMGGTEILIRFNINQKIYTAYHPDLVNTPDRIQSIIKISQQESLIGTGYGLYIFNEQSEEFFQYLKDAGNPESIPSNKIITIFQDKTGIVWLGTEGGGISKFDTRGNSFRKLLNREYSVNLSDNTEFLPLHEDKQNNNLWVGTRSKGLISLETGTGESTYYSLENIRNPMGDKSSRTTIISIHQFVESPEILWMGVAGKGLIKFNKTKNEFTLFNMLSPYSKFALLNRDNPNLFSTLFIQEIAEDKYNTLWLAARFGLYKFDTATETFSAFKNHQNDSSSIANNDLTCLLFENDNSLWIGTNGSGLDKFDVGKNIFSHFTHEPNNPNSISSNYIICLFKDKSNTIWIGTELGLNKLEVIKNKNRNNPEYFFRRYYKKDGLPSGRIFGILEDDSGNLWISTDRGLSKFEVSKNQFTNYDKFDGLQGNEFYKRSCLKTSKGELLFGGPNGISSFFPDSIKSNSNIPEIVITEFLLFNKTVKPKKNTLLEKTITETNEIILNHDQSVFSFKFSALNYTAPIKNQYAYKMEGFDREWVFTNSEHRFASYTNLDPGEYVFRVKGSNNDGVWNTKGASIKITILPPWWAAWWAYLIYVVFALFVFSASAMFYLNQQNLKYRLELEHEHFKKLSELDKVKSRFFSNISHEFRTPLTLIKGPVQQIIDKTNERENFKNANLIYRNANKLDKLVTQLMDLSKLEAGAMRLNAIRSDLVSFFKNFILSFAALAESKKISLKFISANEEIIVYFDREKAEKIFNNILSNAIKFTPAEGQIKIELTKKENFAEVKISDTGIGIPADRLPRIFDRFYQVEVNHNSSQSGTGIGLALTKELVELHNGEIEAVSEEGAGTSLIVKFPLGKAHLKKDEIIDEEIEHAKVIQTKFDEKIPQISSMEKNEYQNNNLDLELLNGTSGKPILLIVEDNLDLRMYLSGCLNSIYSVIEAVDGQDGYEKAIYNMPDIIVSDIMMPKMDGFELCEKLKFDERTCHIPVILLTAKAGTENKIEGLETGADDYITKPFDAKELKARIKNLIDQRKKLWDHFQKEGLISFNIKELTSLDKDFLKKVLDVINKNISNTEFGVEFFAGEIALSRVTLHKKLVALTGEAPSELIKRARLNKAAKLLENKTGNISEIAFEVGFGNPAYFSECFKKQFGVSPSKYTQNYFHT
ncbi:MAG: response regulator [Ignavibacteriae bacterium]|nr:hybrid sensor histidine kinase/response regulator [Ignavibacteriota bacterium]NOH00179.1 response regulator [Ignavibacteriota bacterium]